EGADVADGEAEHTETLAGGHLIAGGVAGRVPHGWVGLVVRLGQHLAGRQGPVLALVALVLVLCPHLDELTDDVFPDLSGDARALDVLAVEEAEDLVTAGTAAGPELEAAVGKVVEHGDSLGHLGGMVHLREGVEDARPEVDALG